jgi:hypothetical protein
MSGLFSTKLTQTLELLRGFSQHPLRPSRSNNPSNFRGETLSISPPANLGKTKYMKIQNLTWKDKIWATGILLALLFVLYMFSVEALKDSGEYFGQMIVNEFVSFK